jgi:hypothetical protein
MKHGSALLVDVSIMINIFGWLGMSLSIIGYFLIVNGFFSVGLGIAVLSCIIYGFYAYKMKIWNLFFLQLIFLVANVSGIIHLNK